jgi:hypothetical protein
LILRDAFLKHLLQFLVSVPHTQLSNNPLVLSTVTIVSTNINIKIIK